MAIYKNSMEKYWDSLGLLDRKILLALYNLELYSDQYDKIFRRLNGKLKVDLYHYWLRSIKHDTDNMGKTPEERQIVIDALTAINKANQAKRDEIAATSAKVNAPKLTALKTKAMIRKDKLAASLANEAKKAKARAKYAEKTKEAKAAKARNRAKVAAREKVKLNPIPVPVEKVYKKAAEVYKEPKDIYKKAAKEADRIINESLKKEPIPVEAAENPPKEKVDRMTGPNLARIKLWEDLKKGNPLQIAVLVNSKSTNTVIKLEPTDQPVELTIKII